MPTASESIGEGEPWVLEVMGLPFPITDSGLGEGRGCYNPVFHTIHTYLPSPFFLPSFQVKRTLFINGISKYAEPEKIKKHFE